MEVTKIKNESRYFRFNSCLPFDKKPAYFHQKVGMN